MSEVVPRWEWRTFRSTFGELEGALRDGIDAVASAETYIPCDTSDINVKIRHGQIDVKVRHEVDTGGLELWSPVLKASFPIGPDVIRNLFDLWRLPVPLLARASYTLDQFLTDVITNVAALHVVAVAKERWGSARDGCRVELAALTFDGTKIRTVAVEGEDPQRVGRTVRALGLSGTENVSYVAALKRFLRDARPPAHHAPGRAPV